MLPPWDLAAAGALARYGAEAALSHETAARRWGLPLVGESDRDQRIHLTIPHGLHDRHVPGVRAHRADLPATHIVRLDGLATTSALRTVLDIGRKVPLREAVALADSALRDRRLTLRQLHEGVSQTSGNGSRRLRRMVLLADPDSGSVFESLTRVSLIEARLGPVQSQLRLPGLDHPYDLALEWAHLIIECDGREHHREAEVLDRDLMFGNAVAGTDWRLVRLRWEHVWPSAEPALAIIRAAVLAGRGPRVRQRRRRSRPLAITEP